MENKTKLSPPWITYYSELTKFFSNDPEVHPMFNKENMTISIFVDNTDKADALTSLLKPCVEFGNVNVAINVIPPNNSQKTRFELMKIALANNPACKEFKSVKDVFGNKINYALFNNEVVQFFADNIGDPNGFKTMLYSEIAEDIFKEHDGVFFSTAAKSVWKTEWKI